MTVQEWQHGELCLALGKLRESGRGPHSDWCHPQVLQDLLQMTTDTYDGKRRHLCVRDRHHRPGHSLRVFNGQMRFGISNGNAQQTSWAASAGLPAQVPQWPCCTRLLVRMSRYVKRPEPEDKWPVKLFPPSCQQLWYCPDRASTTLRTSWAWVWTPKKYLRLDWHPKAKSRFRWEKAQDHLTRTTLARQGKA